MSSDESSIEDSPHLVYKILKQRWRAKAVTAWLREMDAVYLSMRITEGQNTGNGLTLDATLLVTLPIDQQFQDFPKISTMQSGCEN